MNLKKEILKHITSIVIMMLIIVIIGLLTKSIYYDCSCDIEFPQPECDVFCEERNESFGMVLDCNYVCEIQLPKKTHESKSEKRADLE